jgi:hypothetical protein
MDQNFSPDISRIVCCDLETGNPLAGLSGLSRRSFNGGGNAATANNMTVLPGVLECSFGYAQDKLTLRRTVQVRLGSNSLRLPGGPPASPCSYGGQAQPSSRSRHIVW